MGRWSRRKKYVIDSVEGTKRPLKRYTGIVKHQSLLTFFSVLAVTLTIIGGSYAVFSSVSRSSSNNTIQVGTLKITYDDTSSGLGDIINLSNAYPVTDAVGQASKGYKFSIQNTGTLASDYSIRIIDDDAMINADGDTAANLIAKTNLKYSVNGSTPALLSSISTTVPTWMIATGSLQPGESKTYDIKMWIKSDAGNDALNKHYHGKVVIEGIRGEEYEQENLALWYDAIDHGTVNNTWKDLSGNGNDATLTGFLHNGTDGWKDNSLYLPEGTSGNRVLQNTTFTGMTSFTMEVTGEFYPNVAVSTDYDSTKRSYPRIIGSAGGYTGSYENIDGVDISNTLLDAGRQDLNAHFRYGIADAAGKRATVRTLTGTLSYSIVWDEPAKRLTAYRDTKIIFDQVISYTHLSMTKIGLAHGRNSQMRDTSLYRYFTVRVYSKALDYFQVYNNYQYDKAKYHF